MKYITPLSILSIAIVVRAIFSLFIPVEGLYSALILLLIWSWPPLLAQYYISFFKNGKLRFAMQLLTVVGFYLILRPLGFLS